MKAGIDAEIIVKDKNTIMKAAANALAEIMLVMEGEAVRKCPVDTGRLRASIHLEKKSDYHWLLVDGVDYGIFVEMGTFRSKMQPFFRPALSLAKIRAKGIITKHLREVG